MDPDTLPVARSYQFSNIVLEEAAVEDLGKEPYDENHPVYFPPELGSSYSHMCMKEYHCYLLEMNQNFNYEVHADNLVLLLRSRLEIDGGIMNLELEVGRGSVFVGFKYIGIISLHQELVVLCRRFQVTLFTMFLTHKVDKLNEAVDRVGEENEFEIDYFVLPSVVSDGKHMIDWRSVQYMSFSGEDVCKLHVDCNAGIIQTNGGPVCTCMIRNSLVYTPHNGYAYCITDIFNNLNGNSLLKMRDGSTMTYKDYYKHRHSIQLHFSSASFLKGRHIFNVRNYLHSGRRQKDKEEPGNPYVELPPELCRIIISPLSINILYSFSFVPSIMHRVESSLLAVNLKRMHLRHWHQQEEIPTIKVLEAITSKKCLEKLHLESLEALGDSFLKYCVSQQLFTTFQNDHEGLLSARKDKIISNAALCKLGCRNNLPGFIRDEYFEPTKWAIPGDVCRSSLIEEILSDDQKIYIRGRRKIKSKKVADVVEALIGAYLSTGGEWSGLHFLDWIGIRVDFMNTPYERNFQVQAEKHVLVKHLELLLNYTFKDPSLLVEAMTHGSFMGPEIPKCYQRLEFLGDSVLDFLITMHLYKTYPGMSPGLLTDMRSASVNNDYYAQAALRAGLHKYIMHTSTKLHDHMILAVKNFEDLGPNSTFGWESEIFYPKVLGDVIESLGAAILVDSGFNKEVVFRSIHPLLEPLVTPETVRLHPIRELNQLCQKFQFELRKFVTARDNGGTTITVEVKANGSIFKHTSTATNRKLAKKLAAKEVLMRLKETFLRN